MKHCCGWCYRIYTADKKFKDINPNQTFCSQSCLDAESLFKQLVELQHNVYTRKRVPRLGDGHANVIPKR